MRAYVKIVKDEYKRLGEFLATNAEYMITLFFNGEISAEQLEFDMDLKFEKEKKIESKYSILIVDKTINAKYVVEQKYIYSYAVFMEIINIGKHLDDISKIVASQDENFNRLLKSKMNSREEYIKTIIYYLLTTNGDIVCEFFTLLGQFLVSFGFISNVYEKEKNVNKCNILNTIYDFYIIYETFHLFKVLKKEQKLTNLFLFSSYDEIIGEKEVIQCIDNILTKYEDNINFIHHSKFDKENDRWETIILFSNALSLAIYELRMQLSENIECTIKICENPLCNKTIEVYHKGQKYCNEDDNPECKRARQNARKNKSLKNKK